jgi:hypothetical protein
MKESAVGFAVLLFTLRHYHGFGERSGHKLVRRGRLRQPVPDEQLRLRAGSGAAWAT